MRPPIPRGGGPVTAAEMLDDQLGQDVPGGCVSCSAVQTVVREDEGIYRMTISHDDSCPVLAHHSKIGPLEARLAALREDWRRWRDIDPEMLAAREDLDFGDIMPEAGGDRVLAARAWRAGILAQLREIGHGLADQLARERERVAGA